MRKPRQVLRLLARRNRVKSTRERRDLDRKISKALERRRAK